MTSYFPIRYVKRTDPEYRKLPRYQFVLRPGKDGSLGRKFIHTASNLQSAVEHKILSETIPHTNAKGRELTLEFLKDQVAKSMSLNEIEWVSGCDGVLILYPPNMREKLVSILSNLLFSSHVGGLQKLLSVQYNGEMFALKVNLSENKFVGQNSLVIMLTNPKEPAAVIPVEMDSDGSIQLTPFYATKQAIEHFALKSLRSDLCSHLDVPLEAIEYRYEPLGNKFPDFELIVDGQEWAVEVTRIESDMVSYMNVERVLDKKAIGRAIQNSVTDVNAGKALREALSKKAKRRVECSRYSRCCLLLVDTTDSIGDKHSEIWNGCDLSSFESVVVVKRIGSVDYIKGRTDFRPLGRPAGAIGT